MNKLLLFIIMITCCNAYGRVNIENPADGSVQNGITTIHGWSNASQQLRVLIDGQFVTNLRADTIRADVNPEVETGFSMAFNYALLTDGDHAITVVDALTGDSDTVLFSTVSLSDGFINPTDISPREFSGIHLNVKGREVSMAVKWDTATQSYRLVSVNVLSDPPAISFGKESLDIVNRIRTEGVTCHDVFYPPVPPLKWNDGLALAAEKQSIYLDETNLIGHTGRGGSNPGQRMAAENIGGNLGGWRENAHQIDAPAEVIIQGYIDDVGIDPPGHCINIMSGDVTDFGSAKTGKFSVQDFARIR